MRVESWIQMCDSCLEEHELPMPSEIGDDAVVTKVCADTGALTVLIGDFLRPSLVYHDKLRMAGWEPAMYLNGEYSPHWACPSCVAKRKE